MRGWEFVLLTMQAAMIGMLVMARRHRALLHALCLFVPVPLFAHLLAEGFRWQMVPAYAFVLCAFLAVVFGLPRRVRAFAFRFRRAWRTLAIGLLLVSCAFPLLLPVPPLETPTGNDKVGTVVYHWVDRGRMETTPGKTDHYRELNVQLWYPAQPAKGTKQAPYVPDLSAMSRYASGRWHIPSALLGYLRLTRTHAYAASALPVGQDRYPIIVLSHGWPGFRFAYHYLVTDLASKGYVVAAVEHTYGTPASVFPDGRVETIDTSLSELDLPGWDRIIDDVWSEDDRFVLDQLAKLNAGDPDGRFTHRLNLEQVGVIGHSYGGDNALAVLRKDKRFKAGISLDGSFYGAERTPLSKEQSFLWMCTNGYADRLGLPQPSDGELADAGITRATYTTWTEDFFRRRNRALAEGGQVLQLRDANHSSFSDLYLYSPILRWHAGAPKPSKIHGEILKYVDSFFSEHLNDAAPGLLERKALQDNRVLWNPPTVR